MPPLGWIPPKYRESIGREATDEELLELSDSCSVVENGVERKMTVAELRDKIRVVTGVKDTRDGTVHGQISGVKFVSFDV